MVKGITRQVVVVKGSDDASFEQAIFLVRERVLSKGGITEEALLREAKLACRNTSSPRSLKSLIWAVCGAAIASLVWLLTVII